LAHANLLQLVIQHGTDSEGDLGLLSRNKIHRSVRIIAVSATRNVLLCQSFQSLLGQRDLRLATGRGLVFADP